MNKQTNQDNQISDEQMPLFEHEIEQIEHMKNEGIEYDRNKRNKKHVNLISVTMCAIALITTLHMLEMKQTGTAIALLCAFGGGFLLNIKKAEGA